ncbi:hypothetical protein BB558_001683 [Smittium angustum]|uniref:Uncharacterized protein n=1 Tax=Smittium angustum TaxID=133377 RepID=A0A2U1JAT3_SMIAN|nr:hypothetical protein BB558_001683 [Smittium angustum]
MHKYKLSKKNTYSQKRNRCSEKDDSDLIQTTSTKKKKEDNLQNIKNTSPRIPEEYNQSKSEEYIYFNTILHYTHSTLKSKPNKVLSLFPNSCVINAQSFSNNHYYKINSILKEIHNTRNSIE